MNETNLEYRTAGEQSLHDQCRTDLGYVWPLMTKRVREEYDYLSEIVDDETGDQAYDHIEILWLMLDRAQSGDYGEDRFIVVDLQDLGIAIGYYVEVTKLDLMRVVTFRNGHAVRNLKADFRRKKKMYVWCGSLAVD